MGRNIKILVTKIALYFYWKYRNYMEGLMVYNYSLRWDCHLGKRTMVREDTEIGHINLGDFSYISGPRSYVESADIGKYCSIARQVIIGVSGHNYDWVTTSPVITAKKYGFIDKDFSPPQKERPKIGNDVWIGLNVIVMRGVVIGDGAVVAAGSVVTSNVLPYSIVGGIPAKHIRFRFTEDQIDQLMMIKWWDWDIGKIKNETKLFYNIEAFIGKHGKP
jgi:acetyltransferase-like isoleucine patch superfamily enzyme